MKISSFPQSVGRQSISLSQMSLSFKLWQSWNGHPLVPSPCVHESNVLPHASKDYFACKHFQVSFSLSLLFAFNPTRFKPYCTAKNVWAAKRYIYVHMLSINEAYQGILRSWKPPTFRRKNSLCGLGLLLCFLWVCSLTSIDIKVIDKRKCPKISFDFRVFTLTKLSWIIQRLFIFSSYNSHNTLDCQHIDFLHTPHFGFDF